MTEVPLSSICSSKNSLEKLQQEIDRLRNELEICKSKQYRFLEIIPQIALVANYRGEIVYLNRQWQEYTGLLTAKTTKEQFFSAIAPQQRDRFAREWQQAIAARRSYQTNISLRKADLTYNCFQLEVTPILNPDDTIDIWVGMCKEREGLAEKKQFVQAVLDNLSEGIVACNAKGELTLFNRATEKFHGLPQRAILPEQWSQYYNLYLADGKTAMKKTEIPLFRALQGESIAGVEMTIVPKQGQTRHIIASADPIYSASGAKLGAVVAMRDISDRVAAETRLQLKEAKFQTLFDRFLNWVIVLAPEGKIKEINRTALKFIGITNKKDLIERPFFELEWFRQGEKEKLKRAIQRAGKGKLGECEIEALGAENKRATMEFAMKPVLNRVGKVTEIIVEAQDITKKKQAETALAKSKTRWELAVRSTGDGIFDWNVKNGQLYMSEWFKKMLGYEDKEIENTYNAWVELVHPQDIDRVLETIKTHLKAKTAKFAAEYRLRCKDGTYKWFLARGKAQWDETGRPIRTIGYLSDINDRVVAEKKLQAREAKFRTLFDRSGYWVVVLEPDGKIKEINRTISEFIGVKNRQNLIEQSLFELEWFAPAEAEKLKTAVKYASQGKLGECEIEALGAENKRATMEFTVRPVLNDTGKVREIIAEARDITAKKQAETALKISQERWQLILEGTGDGIFDWNITTQEAFMSEALKNTLGYEDKEIENSYTAWEKLVHPQDLPQVKKAIETHLKKRVPKYKAEYRMRCKDGSYKWILAWGKAKWDEKTGRPLRMVGSHTDIDDRKRSEVLLKQREQLYRLLADNSTDIIAVRNKEGILDYISPAILSMLGYRPEEVSGKSIYQLFHPDDAKALQKTYAVISQLPEKIVHTQRLRHRDGHYIWVETVDRPIRSRNGKTSSKFISVCRDISDRKLAEEQVIEFNRELEERVKRRTAQLEAINRLKDDSLEREQRARSEIQVYADIVKNIQIGLCIWHLPDKEKIESFRLVATNPAASGLLGLPIEEQISQKLIEIFPNALTEYKQYLKVFAEVIKTNRIREFDECYYKKPGRSKIILALKAFPLPGNCVGVSFEDITRRKQTEKALIASNRQYSNVVNSVGEVIFQTDTQGIWTFLNPAWEKITKYPLEESINTPFENYIFSAKSKRNIKALFLDLIREKKKYFEYEFRCQTQKGTMRWLEIKFQLDRDERGKILGTVGTIDDITARKRAEVTLAKRAKELTKLNANLLVLTAELEKRNQELDSFAHVISHDLKEPLRAVGRLSQWLQEDLEDKLDDDTRHQMNLLGQRVERMQAFIDGLLQYCRLGRTHSEPELINLNEFIADIIDSLCPPPEFKIEVAREMPSLYGESLPLQQVFFNLISNAIKHHHLPDGAVTISHRDLGNFYEFSVSDNGPGIEPENLAKIFVIFKTLKPSKDTKNTGIGLSIVKKSIEDRGGKIKVESELGKGTTFRFTWPKLNLPGN